jgi:hypothetical protein
VKSIKSLHNKNNAINYGFLKEYEALIIKEKKLVNRMNIKTIKINQNKKLYIVFKKVKLQTKKQKNLY